MKNNLYIKYLRIVASVVSKDFPETFVKEWKIIYAALREFSNDDD